MAKVHPLVARFEKWLLIRRVLRHLRHGNRGLGCPYVFRGAVGWVFSFERLRYCRQISEVRSLLVFTETLGAGEPDIVVGTILIRAPETGAVLFSRMIMELF